MFFLIEISVTPRGNLKHRNISFDLLQIITDRLRRLFQSIPQNRDISVELSQFATDRLRRQLQSISRFRSISFDVLPITIDRSQGLRQPIRLNSQYFV